MKDVKKWAKWIALALAVAFLLTSVLPVLANEADQQRLQEVQQQMQQQQSKVAQAQRQVDSVSEQLRLIQVDLDGAQNEYKEIMSRLSYTEEQISINTQILKKAEKNLAERSKILNNRMRDVYKNGQISYLDVLLGASDFGDFTTRLDVLKRVLNQDVVLIAKVKADRELILEKKAQLETDKAAILTLKDGAAEKKRVIESRKKEREVVLGAAVNQRDIAERAYQELVETSRRIEQLIRSQQRSRGSETTGAMIWPYSGEITSPFGWRTHPIFGTSRFHSGIDLGADYGDPIVAADGGVVIYADWMGGYGKAVIIDHGNGISTLYAHNSDLVVSEGQRIGRGQQVAYAGSTGYSTGPHLHFEVRQNGSPVNPMDYLP